jgi:predicted transport protein
VKKVSLPAIQRNIEKIKDRRFEKWTKNKSFFAIVSRKENRRIWLKTGVEKMQGDLIRKALDAAGYHHSPATEQALLECFKDYVDAGYWSNLDSEDVEDLTVTEMCRGLMK